MGENDYLCSLLNDPYLLLVHPIKVNYHMRYINIEIYAYFYVF